MTSRLTVLKEVTAERRRQDSLVRSGKFKWTCADPDASDDAKYRILGEEVGEVARALNEGDMANLREELIQVAAVAVSWVEAL